MKISFFPHLVLLLFPIKIRFHFEEIGTGVDKSFLPTHLFPDKTRFAFSFSWVEPLTAYPQRISPSSFLRPLSVSSTLSSHHIHLTEIGFFDSQLCHGNLFHNSRPVSLCIVVNPLIGENCRYSSFKII